MNSSLNNLFGDCTNNSDVTSGAGYTHYFHYAGYLTETRLHNKDIDQALTELRLIFKIVYM